MYSKYFIAACNWKAWNSLDLNRFNFQFFFLFFLILDDRSLMRWLRIYLQYLNVENPFPRFFAFHDNIVDGCSDLLQIRPLWGSACVRIGPEKNWECTDTPTPVIEAAYLLSKALIESHISSPTTRSLDPTLLPGHQDTLLYLVKIMPVAPKHSSFHLQPRAP